MIPIVIAYIASVACNKTMRMADWCAHNKTLGAHGYFKEHGWLLLKTSIVHIPLFALWYTGVLLPAVNAVIGAAGAAMSATGAAIALPPLTEVTVLTTLAAGWPLDSIGTAIARYMKTRQKEAGEENA